MIKKNFNPTIIKAYRSFCDNMQLQTEDGKSITTNVGVVQGGVTSPLTFAIMIDEMIRNLNKITSTLALADDIVCLCKGELILNRVINALTTECQNFNFEINKKKSAIL